MNGKFKFNEMPDNRDSLAPKAGDLFWLDGKYYRHADRPEDAWEFFKFHILNILYYIFFLPTMLVERASQPVNHYGRSIFTGCQIYKMINGTATIAELRQHIIRGIISAKEAGILSKNDGKDGLPILQYSIDELVEIHWKLAKKMNMAYHYGRMTIYVSGGNQGVRMSSNAVASVCIEWWPFKALFNKEKEAAGLDIFISDNFARPSNHKSVVAAKSGGSGAYLISTRAKDEAIKTYNCDDCLLCYDEPKTGEPMLAECSTNNLILERKDGTLVIPRPNGAYLFGTTAQTIAHIITEETEIPFEMYDVKLQQLIDGEYIGARTMGNAAGAKRIKHFVLSDGRIIEMQDSNNLKIVSKLHHKKVRSGEDGIEMNFHNNRDKYFDKRYGNIA